MEAPNKRRVGGMIVIAACAGRPLHGVACGRLVRDCGCALSRALCLCLSPSLCCCSSLCCLCCLSLSLLSLSLPRSLELSPDPDLDRYLARARRSIPSLPVDDCARDRRGERRAATHSATQSATQSATERPLRGAAKGERPPRPRRGREPAREDHRDHDALWE